MSRSLYVIAAMGLAACLAMSLFMKYLLDKEQERRVDPAVREVQELFGARLDGPVGWEVQDREGERVGRLSISPLAGLSKDRLAKDMGQFVWRRLESGDRPDRLEVLCMEDGVLADTIPVPAPYMRGSGRR